MGLQAADRLASAIRARRVLSASIRARQLPASQKARPGLVLVASMMLRATPEFEAKHPRDDDGQFASGGGGGGGGSRPSALSQPDVQIERYFEFDQDRYRPSYPGRGSLDPAIRRIADNAVMDAVRASGWDPDGPDEGVGKATISEEARAAAAAQVPDSVYKWAVDRTSKTVRINPQIESGDSSYDYSTTRKVPGSPAKAKKEYDEAMQQLGYSQEAADAAWPGPKVRTSPRGGGSGAKPRPKKEPSKSSQVGKILKGDVADIPGWKEMIDDAEARWQKANDDIMVHRREKMWGNKDAIKTWMGPEAYAKLSEARYGKLYRLVSEVLRNRHPDKKDDYSVPDWAIP